MAFGIKSLTYKIRENFRKPKGERLAFIECYFEALEEALSRREKAEKFELEEALNDEDYDHKKPEPPQDEEIDDRNI